MRLARNLVAAALLLASVVAARATDFGGVVVSTSGLASDVGARVLEEGGEQEVLLRGARLGAQTLLLRPRVFARLRHEAHVAGRVVARPGRAHRVLEGRAAELDLRRVLG